MKCVDVEELLPPFADATLDAVQSARVQTHLETCVACSQLLVDVQSVSAVLKTVERPVAPGGLSERARLAALRQATAPSFLDALVAMSWRFALGALAAGAASAVLVWKTPGPVVTASSTQSVTSYVMADDVNTTGQWLTGRGGSP